MALVEWLVCVEGFGNRIEGFVQMGYKGGSIIRGVGLVDLSVSDR